MSKQIEELEAQAALVSELVEALEKMNVEFDDIIRHMYNDEDWMMWMDMRDNAKALIDRVKGAGYEND